MFNYLQVVNPTGRQYTLQAKNPDTGGIISWTIGPRSAITNIPEIYYEQLLQKYSAIGIMIQEMPINFVGELPAAPSRCYPGKAGTVGHFGGNAYYCITDGEWIRNPPFDNQNVPVVCPVDPGTDPATKPSLIIDETVERVASDESGKTFKTSKKYIKGELTVYLNGLPYSEVIEVGDGVFRLHEDDYAPDNLDRVSATYMY